jgi:drug/metabolite transporter (DMT)-like permease
MAIWAGNGIVSKLAVGVFSPAALAWSRWMVAALVLTPFLAHRAWRERRKLRAGFSKLAVLALLGMVLNQTFGYYAAQTLGATEIGLMMGLTPLMTVLLSIWLLRERPTWGALLGGAISILGLAILLGQGDPARLLTQGIHIGSVYMLLSAATYALYSVLLKRWDLGLDNWSMLYGQVLCSLLFLTPFYLLVDGHWPDGSALWLILYAGIPTSALSPWLWMQGIALLGAVKLVVQPEVLNVDGRDAPLFGFVCVQKVLQMLQEVLLACNGCKGTRLYCADGCILNCFIRHGHPSQSGKNCQLQT